MTRCNFLSPRKKSVFLLSVLAITLLLSFNNLKLVDGYMEEYLEEFTTTNFKDSSNTSAWGWEPETDYIYLPQLFPIVGDCSSSGFMGFDFSILNSYAYFAIGSEGMEIIDFRASNAPKVVTTMGANTSVGITSDSEFIYLTSYYYDDNIPPMGEITSYLSILNVNDPGNPQIVGSLTRGSNSTHWLFLGDMLVNDDILYVFDYYFDMSMFESTGYALTSINISDPSNPSLLSTREVTIPVGIMITLECHLFQEGNYIYLPDDYSGFYIFNVTDPSAIELAGNYTIGAEVFTGYTNSGFAYVLDRDRKLSILDLATPTNPVLITTFFPSLRPNDVWVNDRIAYISYEGGNQGGVQIVDFYNPLSPEVLGSTAVNYRARGIVGDLNYLIVGGERFTILEKLHYAASAIAQSTPIWTTQGTAVFTNVYFSDSVITPPDTAIAYFVSPDGGNNWEHVLPETSHTFTNMGTSLLWKAILYTNDSKITPQIDFIWFYFEIQIQAPSLVSPFDLWMTFENRPLFSWQALADAEGYRLQLDLLPTFNSSSLRSYLTLSAQYQIPSDLSEGLWYWRVAAHDLGGEFGPYSPTYRLIIDNITHPADFTYFHGYQGNIISWISHVSDPDSFNVNRDGIWVASGFWEGNPIVISVDNLPVGLHNYTCTVYESNGASAQDTVTVNVTRFQDVVFPTLNSPIDVEYLVDTIDHSLTWQASDVFPSRYLIERNGTWVAGGEWIDSTIQINIEGLPIGTFEYICTVIDQGGNSVSDSVFVRVYGEFVNAPPSISHPADFTYQEGTSGHIITWIPIDQNPASFWVERDGVWVAGGPWYGESITISIDGLSVGIYNYICSVYDQDDNFIKDNVSVNVVDGTNPRITHPDDIYYVEGVSSTSIIWYPSDKHPHSYHVTRNGTVIESGTWNGAEIIITLSSLPPGNYSFICTVYDEAGNFISDTVQVIIPEIEGGRAHWISQSFTLIVLGVVVWLRRKKRLPK